MTVSTDASRDAIAHQSALLARVETLHRAFEKADAALDRNSEEVGGYLYSLAHWGHFVDDKLRFQDPHSRKLVQAIEKAAWDLRDALASAYQYSGFEEAEFGEGPYPNNDRDKVNVCESFF